MAYPSQFTITPSLLSQVETIAALREWLLVAAVKSTWIPGLQAGLVEKVGGKKTGRYALRHHD